MTNSTKTNNVDVTNKEAALHIIESFRSLQVQQVLPLIKQYHGDLLTDLHLLYAQFILDGTLPLEFVLHISDRGTFFSRPDFGDRDVHAQHIAHVTGRAADFTVMVVRLVKKDIYSPKLEYKVVHDLPFLEYYANPEKFVEYLQES